MQKSPKTRLNSAQEGFRERTGQKTAPRSTPKSPKIPVGVIVAIIGALSTLVVAVITSLLAPSVTIKATATAEARLTSLLVAALKTPSATPLATLTLPPLDTPAPTPFMVSLMTGWTAFKEPKSAVQLIESAQGLEIHYSLSENGWVSISHAVASGELVGSNKLVLYSSGTGALNTLEIKVVYQPNTTTNKSPTFSVLNPRATTIDYSKSGLEVPYVNMMCWTETGCNGTERVDVEKIWKVEIGISARAGDEGGSGMILVKKFDAVK